jgi:hypothetical protein
LPEGRFFRNRGALRGVAHKIVHRAGVRGTV